jgi:integrase
MTLKSVPIPKSGRITLWDDASPLGVRITSNGAKTFIVMLGSGKRHTIGRYGDVTLSQARQAAKQLKAERTLGRLLPSSVTVENARKEYLASVDVRPNTRMHYERNLGRLPECRVIEIEPRDINRILDPLGKSSRIQALRTYTSFFNWCLRRHYLDQSPCARMQSETSDSRERVLTDEEIAKVYRAAEAMRGPYGLIVQLLVLTGQRRTEIASLRSGYLDLDNKSICLPRSLTKNGRDHSFPIGTLCEALLSRMSRTDGLLFPARGTTDRAFNGWSKSKAALDKMCGVAEWTLHDLRRTFATKMAALGTPIHVTERLLNHVSGGLGGIVAVYNRHTYMDEMREAVDRYERHLIELLRI